MIPYILVSMLPGFSSLGEASKYSKLRNVKPLFGLYFVLLVVFVGFRFNVGPDWYAYLKIYSVAQSESISKALIRSEPGYMLINIVSARLGGGIVLVNLICAGIASWAIYGYCKDQSRPWLAAFILVSFTLVTIIMGLNRQGVAVSLTFLAIRYLNHRKAFRYVATIAFAASFHVSALILLPLVTVNKSLGWIVNVILLVSVIAAVGFYVYIFEMANLQQTYIAKNLHSGGAYFRFVFHVLAALIFLAFWRRMRLNEVEIKIYRILSYAVVALVPALIFAPSTTAIDRLAFYLIPLQVVVFSNLPNILGRRNEFLPLVLFFVLCLYFANLIVWFFAGNNAEYFVPYSLGWFGLGG